ncbi:MAG: hypothetical protein JWQ71_1086 [Pedosphaera sp.]|nr:hypothetical protein [Pedosphaera sp.]
MSDHFQWTRKHELLFGIRRSIRYHARRRRFFDRLKRGMTFLTVMCGMGTFAMLLAHVPPAWPIATAMTLTVLAVFDLLVNTAEGVRLHADLGRRFTEIEMDLVLTEDNLTDQQVREFANQRLRVVLEEPPTMRVLDCICHNEVVRVMGHNKAYEVKLSKWQRFFANFLDVSPDEIREVPEVPAPI